MLACTWNRSLVEEVGAAAAKEVKENNISFWLTPAVNIHRSPLCGRNFEYYSEDPYLAERWLPPWS
ncbi:MAG: glycoside hydrolase family 3 N-terminal domain-containing protein [Lachnospiraceae bacterium]